MGISWHFVLEFGRACLFVVGGLLMDAFKSGSALFGGFSQEADGEMVLNMLRRVSVEIDVNRINTAGMTALHQVHQPSWG